MDTVPTNLDAVLFWMVWDAQKAALEVENYRDAVAWAAQTALRDMIGKTLLADILVRREKMDVELQKIIEERTTLCGVALRSVEISDVIIPAPLEDTMSRQAQAERERQARVILGESEKQIAVSFRAAAEVYGANATALHLRAMNMLFEGLKECGALVIVPSSALEIMGLGGLTGLTAMSQGRAAAGTGEIQGSRTGGLSANINESSVKPAPWQGFLVSFYGGIDEEVLMRLFLPSLLAFLGKFVSRTAEGRPTLIVLLVANILVAIVFGLGHLPATANLVLVR